MEDPGQDVVASSATPGAGKSKLETLPKEDLIKFAKKQMMLMQKVKSRYICVLSRKRLTKSCEL
uniref:Uncharacterized protein n=1 Tax=Vombatus ursinus TaxID=29139 RepID=A0A4X2K2L1_VOMUR